MIPVGFFLGGKGRAEYFGGSPSWLGAFWLYQQQALAVSEHGVELA